jgi:antitoxin YefM
MVQAVAYSNFRKDLKAYMRKVNDDADMIFVTNTDPDDNVIVMSATDYESLIETLRIYQNPYLRNKITTGLNAVRSSAIEYHDISSDSTTSSDSAS